MADVYMPHISGITGYISENKRALVEKGHDVFIFTFGDEEYKDNEPNVIRSPGLPLLNTGYYISFNYSKQARKLLRSMDIVHVQHPFLSGSLALRYCRPRCIPIVFTNHTRYDLYARAYLPVLPDVIGETALEAYMPAFCRACDLVISPSEGMRQVLKGMGVTTPIETVPNGVDLRPLKIAIQPIDRSELGLSSESVVLIYTGRLGPEKNLPFLLRSFAGIAQAYEHVHLLLVGDGPERGNLENIVQSMNISPRVHFIGMVNRSDIYRYLATSDAFVTASVTEVHPLSVIEALASGLPVMGIDSPGISDTVEDGITGLLVKEEDLAAFTAKLVRLISEHEWRKQMGNRGRQAAENFSIERTSERMVELYKKVVEEKKSLKPGFRVILTRLVDRWRG
jgi:glycosyltransferase involved in cell wall biosynthesis